VRGKPDWPSDQCGSFDFPHGVHEKGDCVSNGLQLGVGLQVYLVFIHGLMLDRWKRISSFSLYYQEPYSGPTGEMRKLLDVVFKCAPYLDRSQGTGHGSESTNLPLLSVRSMSSIIRNAVCLLIVPSGKSGYELQIVFFLTKKIICPTQLLGRNRVWRSADCSTGGRSTDTHHQPPMCYTASAASS
jgi:hypothetical protein